MINLSQAAVRLQGDASTVVFARFLTRRGCNTMGLFAAMSKACSGCAGQWCTSACVNIDSCLSLLGRATRTSCYVEDHGSTGEMRFWSVNMMNSTVLH